MNEEVTLIFTVNEVNLILKGISKLPLEETVDLFFKIRDSANKQLTPQESTVPVEKES